MKQSKLIEIGLSALLCFAATAIAGDPPEMTNNKGCIQAGLKCTHG